MDIWSWLFIIGFMLFMLFMFIQTIIAIYEFFRWIIFNTIHKKVLLAKLQLCEEDNASNIIKNYIVNNKRFKKSIEDLADKEIGIMWEYI